jgi:RNA polymerase sigma-70 factor (ECF subfamily)
LDLGLNPKGIRNELADNVEYYFHEYSERLCRYAFTLLRDNDEAKDAVQAVFLKFWEKAAELDSNQSIKSYLYTSVHNHCLNVQRHQKVKARHLATAKEPIYDMEEAMSQHDLDQRVMNSLKYLPPRCRRIFEMSRLEGKKYAAIAAELRISVKTVEAQMGKALKILRNTFFGK